MRFFISDISKRKFPDSEKVSGKSLRPLLLLQIRKEVPEFNEASILSISELSEFRRKLITTLREGETTHLTELEQKVLDSFEEGNTLVDKIEEIQNPGLGERLADKVAAFGGSWAFLISFIAILAGWMILNILLSDSKRFDPFPFILLNLILSTLAALQGPIIMMSQNRQEAKDRDRGKKDYIINLKAELEVRLLHEKMNHLVMRQQQELIEMQEIQIEMMQDILGSIRNRANGR